MPTYKTKLTPRQAEFARQYLIDLSSANAAVRAGFAPKFAARQGYKLLQLPHVQDAIREQMEARNKRTQLDQDRVLRELAAIAFFDPRKLFDADGRPKPITELDDATAAALNGLDVQEVFEGSGDDRVFVGYLKKYKVADKNTALANAMKHLGLLKDSLALTGPVGGPVEVSVKQEVSEALVTSLKAAIRARRG